MKIFKYLFVFIGITTLVGCGTQKNIVNKPSSPVATPTTSPDSSRYIQLPSKDFRAVWIATIGGIDWPRERFDEESQKQWYEQMLDTLQKLNINAVFFEVQT